MFGRHKFFGGAKKLTKGQRRKRGKSRSVRRSLRAEQLEGRQMMALVVPVLDSQPNASQTLFLDFDGAPDFDWTDNFGNVVHAHGAGANDADIPAFSIDNDAANFSDNEHEAIYDLWRYVSEKFSAFDINVTTVDPGVLVENQAARVIIGGMDSDWNNRNQGGCASVGGFSRTDRDNTSFVFSRDAISLPASTLEDRDFRYLGEAITHEAAHTLVVDHQRHITDPDTIPVTIDDYYNGDGTFSPIMGQAGTIVNDIPAIKSIWWRTGMYGQDSPDADVDELDALTAVVGNRPDDHPYPSSLTLLDDDGQGRFSESGVIGRGNDTDGFRFFASSTTASFTVNNNTTGGMLTPRVELRNHNGSQVIPATINAPANGNSATLTVTNLEIGSAYTLIVSSDGRYSSLGSYTIEGTQDALAKLVGGVLTINGFDNVDDYIQIELMPDGDLRVADAVSLDPLRVAEFRFAPSLVHSIVVNTGTGNDKVHFLDPLPGVETTLNLGDHFDTVEMWGHNFNNVFEIGPAAIEFSNQHIDYWATEAIVARGFDGEDAFNVNTDAMFTIYGGGRTDRVNVYGAAPTPAGLQHTVYLEGGADVAVVYPRDAQGNLTVNGNLGIGGGTEHDFVQIQDDDSTLPINYAFTNQFGPGTTNIGGMGAGVFGAGSDVESLVVRAGQGNDEFAIHSYQAPTGLSLNGGIGVDTIDYSQYQLLPSQNGVVVDFSAGKATRLSSVGGIENAIGTAGSDQLVGDAAANRLEGRGGRDLLIGGAGADVLHGGADEDILLAGGSTSVMGSYKNIIMGEWTRTDNTYAERVANLLNGGGLNGATTLNLQNYATDAGGNTLTGADGMDLYFGSLARDARDHQRSLGEVFIDVDGVEQGNIQIDATALGVTWMLLDYASIDPTQSHNASLQPGSHHLQILGGTMAYFTVTADYTVDYDPALEGILTGRGTSSLRINGAPIQIDATPLGTSNVVLDYEYEDPTAPINRRMMPGSHHLQILGGTIAYFTVTNEGTVDYDPAFDGVLSGRGTNVLRVTGAPILVDATALGTSLSVLDYDYVDPTAPIDRRMMPGVHHLQIYGGTIAYFTVTNEGTVDYDHALDGVLSGRGTNVLKVNGAPIQVDATPLGTSFAALDYESVDPTAPIDRRMMPGVHHLQIYGGTIAYFTVTNEGTVDYDPALEGALTGRGTNTLHVIGRRVTVDATEANGGWVNVDYTTYNTGSPITAQMMPGRHFAYGHGDHVYEFTVSNDGLVDYDHSLDGIFSGRGTSALRIHTFTGVPQTPDFNQDATVNADDLVAWSDNFGASAVGDADGDNDSDGADFLAWQRQLGQQNEQPGAAPALAAAIAPKIAAAAPSFAIGGCIPPFDFDIFDGTEMSDDGGVLRGGKRPGFRPSVRPTVARDAALARLQFDCQPDEWFRHLPGPTDAPLDVVPLRAGFRPPLRPTVVASESPTTATLWASAATLEEVDVVFAAL
jgi:hypothetical protein